MELRFPEEHILHLTVAGGVSLRMVCTDQALEELVIGFLLNEGLIQKREEIRHFRLSPDHTQAEVALEGTPSVPRDHLRPSGLGGEQLGTAMPQVWREVKNRYPLPYILHCARSMDAQARRYAQTGGIHCSALFTPWEQLALFEDIGRHNTLDKLAGAYLKGGLSPEDALLVTTGRISLDMVKKAATMGVSCIASYSTPTQSACDTAARCNITLIRYLNKETQAICTVPERTKGE